MKLTPEEIQNNADAVKANLSGKQVEIWSEVGGPWVDIEDPSWDFEFSRYRPKPEPKTRAWSSQADVPSLCWIRYGQHPDQFMVTCIQFNGIGFASTFLEWVHLSILEYSTDRKTWLACTVIEP